MKISQLNHMIKNHNTIMMSFHPTNEENEKKNVVINLKDRLEGFGVKLAFNSFKDNEEMHKEVNSMITLSRVASGILPLKRVHKRSGVIIVYRSKDSLRICWSCTHPNDSRELPASVRKKMRIQRALKNSYKLPETDEELKHILEYVPKVIHTEFLQMLNRADSFFKLDKYYGVD